MFFFNHCQLIKQRKKTIGVCLLFLFVLLFSTHASFAQNCFSTGFNNKTFYTCSGACANIQLSIPDLRATSNYRFSNINYTPFPYTATNGNTDSTFYRTVQYSNAIDFGFPFCFYDSVFTSFVLSPHGLITFENVNANCWNNPVAVPIPYAPYGDCEYSAWVPRSTIFGCYQWLNPRLDSYFNTPVSPQDRKIEWRIEGTIPCRRLIVSYYHIGSGGNVACSLDSPATFEMVMYESTALIDIYFENYTCPEIYNSGKAICGIQNWPRNKAVAAPGKNATIWTAHHEAYRFTPSGGASRFVSCKLYNLNGSFVADATTSINAADSSLLNIQFNNVCPVTDTAKYLVQTSYTACTTGDIISSTDTITIIKHRLNPVIINNGNGHFTTGHFSTYQWLLDGAAIGNATAQNYTATQNGYYQVVVTDSASGCIDTSAVYNYNVTPVTLLYLNAHYNNATANVIEWQTSQEINSDHFIIQRAYTLPHFTAIGSLPAGGNSNTAKNYSFTDSNILYQPTFYRLQQADRDGRIRYSRTVMVNPVKKLFSISRIYPNPANDILHFQFNSPAVLPVTAMVTDMLGRTVQKTVLTASAGLNNQSINLTHIARGKYVLRLFNAGASVQQEFIKY